MHIHELLTPAEAAAQLRVSIGTLANWRARHPSPLPFIKIGRLVRYWRMDIDCFCGRGVGFLATGRKAAAGQEPSPTVVTNPAVTGR